MPDLLAQGAAWLNEQRRRRLSHDVTYVRGGRPTLLRATVGRTVFRMDDAVAGVIHQRTRDYLISAADLVINGALTRPQRGDEIHEVINGRIQVYEVVSINGEPEWRFSDATQLTIRIHTQYIEALES